MIYLQNSDAQAHFLIIPKTHALISKEKQGTQNIKERLLPNMIESELNIGFTWLVSGSISFGSAVPARNGVKCRGELSQYFGKVGPRAGSSMLFVAKRIKNGFHLLQFLISYFLKLQGMTGKHTAKVALALWLLAFFRSGKLKRKWPGIYPSS